MSKPKTPDRIYLIDSGEGIQWCEDRAPGIDMKDEDSVEYVRADSAPVAPTDAPTDAELVRKHLGRVTPNLMRDALTLVAAARYAPAQDAGQAGDAELSPDDQELFARTYEHFDDGTDTTTDAADLMRFVRMGLLECTQYEVTEKGDSVYAARALKSTSAGKGE